MQIEVVPPGAPFAVGIVVAGAGFVLERATSAAVMRLCLIAGSIFSQERQRHITRQIDRARRPVDDEARLRHIHVKLLGDLRGRCRSRPCRRSARYSRETAPEIFSRWDACAAQSSKWIKRGFAVERRRLPVLIAECDRAGFELRHSHACGPRPRPRCGNPARRRRRPEPIKPRSTIACRIHILNSLVELNAFSELISCPAPEIIRIALRRRRCWLQLPGLEQADAPTAAAAAVARLPANPDSG